MNIYRQLFPKSKANKVFKYFSSCIFVCIYNACRKDNFNTTRHHLKRHWSHAEI